MIASWIGELHASATGLRDGALYLLAAPLALAALLATCLLLAPARRPLPAGTLVLVIATASLTRWLPVVEQAVVVPCLLLGLGTLLALNMTARGQAAPAAAIAGGTAVGLGGGMQLASWQEIAGADAVLLAILLLASLLAMKAPRLDRFATGAVVGRRMVGAWIAAIGVLMLALWWRTAHGGAPLPG